MAREETIRALRHAFALGRGSLRGQPGLAGIEQGPLLAAIAYALASLGAERPLVHTDGSLLDALETNDIPYREVKKPADLLGSLGVPLILFKHGKPDPYVLAKRAGRGMVYNARSGALEPIGNPQDYQDFGYEIYASLPRGINNASGLLLSLATSNEGAFLLVLLSTLLVSVLNMSVPVLTSYIVDTVLPQSDMGLVVEALAIVLLATAALVTSQVFSTIAMVRLESALNLRLETSTWMHLLSLPLEFYSQYSSSDLHNRVGAITEMRRLASTGLLSTVLGMVMSLGSFVLMFVYRPSIAGTAAAFSVAMAVLMGWLVTRNMLWEERAQNHEADQNALALAITTGLPQIRVSGSEPFLYLKWLTGGSLLAWSQRMIDQSAGTLEMISRLLSPLGTTVIFAAVLATSPPAAAGGAGVNSVGANQDVASFVAFQSAFLVFNGQMTVLANQLGNTFGRLAVLWRRSSVVIFASSENDIQQNSKRLEVQGEIAVSGLTVQYQNRPQPVLDGLNLHIPKGQYTAITGRSGCGKTTLLRCLLGIQKPEAGIITVDGIDLRDLAIRSYRRQIGVVLQNAPIPSGSIRDVVRAGRLISEEEVWHALEQASVAEDVKAMPMGLDTYVAEGGQGFSGGQRQRISLARALAGKPRLLILDEATSALDARTQAAISRTLDSLQATRIAVAHRLSTIESADQIVVLDQGRVAELGRYGELRNLRGGYLNPSAG